MVTKLPWTQYFISIETGGVYPWILVLVSMDTPPVTMEIDTVN